MFECINFDEHLADFVSTYMQEHQGDYRNYDAMEADMPAIYMRFLNQPAAWLDGLTPGSYFTQFEDPKDLVDWMIAYDKNGVPVPDLLLEQIENVGRPCEKRLLALLKDPEMSSELKMTAVGVLRTMESTQPRMLYIDWQINRDEEDELADNALESLAEMGKSVVQPMLDALNRATQAGKEAMLDVLCRYPGNEKVFQLTQRMFREHPEKRALFADYLGKLGDERALKDLMAAAQEPDLSYIDYLEIRNSIERLGGTAPERTFDGDPSFEALHGMDQ